MSVLIVKKTNRLLVKYAAFPITSTNIEFLTEMVEPFKTIPKQFSIGYMRIVNGVNVKDLLARDLIEDWRNTLKEAHGDDIIDEIRWMHDIDTVELIECDLLVPKS